MLIGIPEEIKKHGHRAGAAPDGVQALAAAGHVIHAGLSFVAAAEALP
ncbi:MAG: hypothetical protein KF834_11375 [Burkholderiales bacterium]|nr:hypothetical protein [Burkholderiales bacterium]